jgi:hypothetical protein
MGSRMPQGGGVPVIEEETVEREFVVGEVVCVRFMQLQRGEVWRPARIVYPPNQQNNIGVEFYDGTRMMVRAGEWR